MYEFVQYGYTVILLHLPAVKSTHTLKVNQGHPWTADKFFIFFLLLIMLFLIVFFVSFQF